MRPANPRAKPSLPARVTLRQDQKRRTRELLLAQAYTLFEEAGFERATMRELAARSGVALGTIFKHFPDKHALLGAAFRQAIASRVDEAFATLPAGDLSARLLHLTRRLYRFYADRPSLSRVLVKELPVLEGPEGEAVRAQAISFLHRVGALFGEAVASGDLRADTDLVAAVAAYWSFYLLGLLSGLAERRFDVEGQLEFVARMLHQHLRSISAHAPRKKERT